MFKESSPTFEQLLSGSERFSIPRYQRGFSWKLENAKELVEDVAAYAGAEGDEALFLGTCIFRKTGDACDVVDGQQRLTTLLILLVACRERAKQLGKEATAYNITSRMSFTDRRGNTSGSKLTPSPNIAAVFGLITGGDWDGRFLDRIGGKQVRRQRRLIEPLYDYFLQAVIGLEEEEFFKFLDSIYRARFIRIDVDEEINALGIFERTNARGADLEVSDLLKNFLYQQDFPQVEERWNEVVENADGQLQRMLKYFYNSARGHVLKKDLYANLKGLIRDLETEEFVGQLVRFSEYFWTFRSGTARDTSEFFLSIGCDKIARDETNYEALHYSIVALREFRFSQPIPVFYAAIQCMMRVNPEQQKPLIRLAQALERYHFVNNIICTRIGNEVEQLYARTCAEFATSTDFAASVDQLIVRLRQQRVSEDEFVQQLAELEYSETTIPWIAYFFDRIQNHECRPGSYQLIFNPENKILRRRKFDIEHFAPQRPRTPHDDATAAVIHRLGNLLVLSEQTNKELERKPASEKLEVLLSSPDYSKFKFVREFVDHLRETRVVWNAEAIRDRSESLARTTYRNCFAF